MNANLSNANAEKHGTCLCQKTAQINAKLKKNSCRQAQLMDDVLRGQIGRLLVDRHLSLTVRAQPPQFTILAHVGQFLPQTSWRARGMASFSPLTRAPEHDVLAARIDVSIILADVHSSCVLWAQPLQIPLLRPSFSFAPNELASSVEEGW